MSADRGAWLPEQVPPTPMPWHLPRSAEMLLEEPQPWALNLQIHRLVNAVIGQLGNTYHTVTACHGAVGPGDKKMSNT